MDKCVVTSLFGLLLILSGSAAGQEPSALVERPYTLTEEREPCSSYAPEKRPFLTG